MNKSLVIELVNLPEEGKNFQGELDPLLYDLPERDAQPVGPLYYDLTVQRFEDELLVRGFLSSPFKFTCVRDNQQFVQTISIEEFGQSYEIDDSSVNLTEALREEVLMAFPSYPRCDEADEPHECKIDDRYLAVDKDPEDGVDEAPQSKSDNRWDALDQLDQFKD
ncbi:YceD family protein [Rubritalea spongiae]|uniref:YceD family protein n=1 Tax=Rubritalea spongiae TaxID=430797 RepID=A0ABW5E4Q2_9BACT